jgi:hypothetical protein
VSEFTATEKVMLRTAVMDAIEDSTTMMAISREMNPRKDYNKIGKGNSLNGYGQTFFEDENIGFYKHLKRLKWFFGSNSREVQLEVKYGLQQIHSVLTNNTELMIFTDIRGAHIAPYQTLPNTTGYYIYVGKYFIDIRTDRQHRARLVYTDMLNHILKTAVKFAPGKDIRNREFYRNNCQLTSRIGDQKPYFRNGSEDGIKPDIALLNPNSWINFIDSCCRESKDINWYDIEIKALDLTNDNIEQTYEAVDYHTREGELVD